MSIILYQGGETEFKSNGIGILSDVLSCEITEERNGAFELEMQYPIDGIHYDKIANRCLLLAKPNPIDNPQPFRIYRISRPISGRVTINAEHISYDLSGVVLSPFTAESAISAMSQIAANSSTENPFSFITDKSTQAEFKVPLPTSARSIMGGQDGSLLDVYGGEYKFDKFQVSLLSARGHNNGISIRYGKNLTDLTQEENIQNVYTGIYPYWADGDGNITQLPEKIVYAEGEFGFTRIMALDMSSEWEEAPGENELREKAEDYIKNNKIGVPAINIQVSFQPLEQTEEYKDIALLERVQLCDTVNVVFEKLGVNATARCIKTVYDCLKNRYSSIELGEAKSNIADTIVQQNQLIKEATDSSLWKNAVLNATNLITGNKGGYVVLRDGDGDGYPDEILIMDKPDIKDAIKVWRWNNGGLGYSKNGFNGPYEAAITQDGTIVASFITTGVLNANIIRAGIIRSPVNSDVYFDLDGGEIACNKFVSSDTNVIALIGYDTISGTKREGIALYDGNNKICRIGKYAANGFGITSDRDTWFEFGLGKSFLLSEGGYTVLNYDHTNRYLDIHCPVSSQGSRSVFYAGDTDTTIEGPNNSKIVIKSNVIDFYVGGQKVTYIDSSGIH